MPNKSLPLPAPGTYVVWGPEKAPEVHLLDPDLRATLLDRQASGHAPRAADAVRYVFGGGFSRSAAAWNGELMEAIAKDEAELPAVRAICACIAIGMPFEEFYQRRGNGGGGEKVRQPRRPVKPQPGGIALPVPVA